MKRLLWLDVAKGLAILIVIYFHFFRTYFEHGVLPPPDWSHFSAGLISALRLTWFKLSGLGFHAVGVFIILSGWALMQSTARRADKGVLSWSQWYRARLLRLYPMYWVAHLVYLISPFTARFEKIDGRFILSLLGLRFVDITNNFYYLNAAWWYFTMLIQFYLIFPLLFRAARKLGPWPFLLLACAIGFLTRYWLLVVCQANGMWIQGGLAICRTAGVRPRDGNRDLEQPAAGACRTLSPRRLWFVRRSDSLSGCPPVLPRPDQLHLVDLATGGCCFLVLVGLAGIIARLRPLAKVIGVVGSFSYGIYLIHHPYVIWLGLRIREQPIWMFLLITLATLAVISAWGILLERAINDLVTRLSRTGTKPAPGAS